MQGTGPPAKMAERREELTPMMRQYFELCAEYEDALVLFQVGDFYETFCEAAEVAARRLEITLTSREDSSGEYPMAGIPIDSAASYVETLLDAGYRVAIADQVQEPEEATGVVDRAVTRVVTPGTVLDDELLTAGSNTYVACLVAGEDGDVVPETGPDAAVAFVDISTGEFRVTSGSHGTIQDELDRFRPAEYITGPRVEGVDAEGMHTPFETAAFEPEAARERLGAYASNPDAVVENDTELRACGALLAYAEYTQSAASGGLEYISRVTRYDTREGMRLDRTALRSLEVFENREGGDDHTLVGVLDDTSCALGRRELLHWLRRPLVEAAAIERRLDAVGELTRRSLVREEAREQLRAVYDIERLIARVSRGRANARDLRSLKTTLDVVPRLEEALADCESDALAQRRAALDRMEDVRGLIGRAIVDEPPIEVTEGGIIREGYDDGLDDLRETEREGREWVADLEEAERERTGIDSLKIGYNEVHGYYIEVTNPNLDRVPDDYTRRQTLKNSERFYTPELKAREDEILGATERADSREYELFREVRTSVAAEADRVQQVAELLAELDVLATLAAVAVDRDYSRPTLGAGGITIEAGRHPVVETTEPTFVPNDTDLTDKRIAVVTGPNMSGKSTYMRQVALICLLAQTGSFVPADRAQLPVLDRVFTRVGASDDIAGGRSTFMREMTELTEILHGATEDSLVLLDEVGRGTSTADGRALARAVTEFVHDEVGAFTLFATHFHGLTDVAAELSQARNLHFTADRSGETVSFVHSVVEGPASGSYGVDVARLAGVPDRVTDRARELLDGGGGAEDPLPRQNGHAGGNHLTNSHAAGDGDGVDDESTGGRSPRSDETDLERALLETDIARMTPLEALNQLDELQRRAEERQ